MDDINPYLVAAGYADPTRKSQLAPTKAAALNPYLVAAGYINPESVADTEESSTQPQRGLIEDAIAGVQSTGKKILGAIDKSAVALSDAMPDWVPGKMSDDDRALYAKRGALLQQDGNAKAPTRWTGMVTSGLAYAPLAAAAPIVTGVAEGTARSQILQDAGVDKATADKAGAAEGLLQAGAQLLPMGKVLFGQGVKTLAKTGATAAAKSGVVGAAQTASSDTIASKILSDGGFEKQAQEYAPTLEKTMEGALFNAGLHMGMETSHAGAGKIASTVLPKKFTPPGSLVAQAEITPLDVSLVNASESSSDRMSVRSGGEAEKARSKLQDGDGNTVIPIKEKKLGEPATTLQIEPSQGGIEQKISDSHEMVSDSPTEAGSNVPAQMQENPDVLAVPRLLDSLIPAQPRTSELVRDHIDESAAPSAVTTEVNPQDSGASFHRLEKNGDVNTAVGVNNGEVSSIHEQERTGGGDALRADRGRAEAPSPVRPEKEEQGQDENPGPFFHSRLEEAIDGEMGRNKVGEVSPERALEWLEAEAEKGKLFGVEDLDNSGLREWLAVQQGPLRIEEINAFIERNRMPASAHDKSSYSGDLINDGVIRKDPEFDTTQPFKTLAEANLFKRKHGISGGVGAAEKNGKGGFVFYPAETKYSAQQKKSVLDFIAELNARRKQEGYSLVEIFPVFNSKSLDMRLAQFIGKVFGAEVIVVKENGQFEGVSIKRRIFLSEKMESPVLAVIGHEVSHFLENVNPEAHQKLKDLTWKYLQEGRIEKRRNWENERKDPDDPEMLSPAAHNEVIADLTGSMWLDPKFWREMIRRDANLFRQVAYVFMEASTKLAKAVKGTNFDVHRIVTDVETTRKILSDVWAEHLQQNDARLAKDKELRSSGMDVDVSEGRNSRRENEDIRFSRKKDAERYKEERGLDHDIVRDEHGTYRLRAQRDDVESPSEELSRPADGETSSTSDDKNRVRTEDNDGGEQGIEKDRLIEEPDPPDTDISKQKGQIDSALFFRLKKTIADVMPTDPQGLISPKDAAEWLISRASGVLKQGGEALKASGVIEWLARQDGPLTPQKIAEFVESAPDRSSSKEEAGRLSESQDASSTEALPKAVVAEPGIEKSSKEEVPTSAGKKSQSRSDADSAETIAPNGSGENHKSFSSRDQITLFENRGPVSEDYKAHSEADTETASPKAGKKKSPKTFDTKVVDDTIKSTDPEHGVTAKISNGYRFVMDSLGRVIRVEAKRLYLNKAQGISRRIQAAAGGKNRRSDDHGGHLLARIFNGSIVDFNHVAQNGKLNQTEYRAIEREAEQALIAGKDVSVVIALSYTGDSKRPDKFDIRLKIDGVEKLFTLHNEIGGKKKNE